jgi:hypothetical protein
LCLRIKIYNHQRPGRTKWQMYPIVQYSVKARGRYTEACGRLVRDIIESGMKQLIHKFKHLRCTLSVETTDHANTVHQIMRYNFCDLGAGNFGFTIKECENL